MLQRIVEENVLHKWIRETDFFQMKKYRKFNEDIKNTKGIPLRADQISQLSIRCCGYGYFQTKEHPMQSQLKQNFIHYLRQAVTECLNLRSIKIEFNGFTFTNELDRIIEAAKELLKRKRKLDKVWIHCRMMKDCNLEHVRKLLEFANEIIRGKETYEEISISMSGWEFSKMITHQQFSKIFNDFAGNMGLFPNSPLKRFKLDISSWYTYNIEAYTFLAQQAQNKSKDILNHMIDSAENSRKNDSDPDRRRDFKVTQSERNLLKTYLEGIDKRYAIQNPIPGRKGVTIKEGDQMVHYEYITSREVELKKKNYQYIEQQIKLNPNAEDRKDLLKILNDGLFIGTRHKEAVREITRKVDERINFQLAKEGDDNNQVDNVNRNQKAVHEHILKFPIDNVMALRVKEFHRLFTDFVSAIRTGLNSLEEIEIDMRCWSGLFQLKDLKKHLDNEFAQEGAQRVMSFVMSKIIPRAQQTEADKGEGGSKLKFTFIM